MAVFDQDFMDTLTDKLASTGRAIGAKAKEVTECAKTSLQIAREEKNLRTAYRQLGIYVYEKSGIEADDAMAPYFSAITEARINIERLKEEQKKAAGDSEKVDDQDEEEADETETVESSVSGSEQEPAERVCPVCRSVVSAQLIYCPKCGDKLK